MSRGKSTFPKKMVKFSKEGNSEMLTEDELVETMENERHRKLNVWREAVSLARDNMKAAGGLALGIHCVGGIGRLGFTD